ARKPFLAIGTYVTELHRDSFFAWHFFGRPDFLVKTENAAMQRILSVVLGQRISLAIQAEFSARDAIAISANRGANMCRAVLILLRGIEAQHHVIKLTAAVRYLDAHNRRAKVGNRHLHATAIGQDI